jgi:DNA repair exonuclease SbcCD ATPase subunit
MLNAATKIMSILWIGWMAAGAAVRARALPQEKKDYLTETEADRIREANNPSDRIKLYVSYADDRLKKFQYELTRTTPERRRSEILNALMNAYSACVDDAADQIQDAKEKQLNIHASLKLLESKGKEFLEDLQKIEQGTGPDFDSYKDTLEDAIEATKDAISDAQKAQKEMLPAPVRRKPS